MVSIFQISVNWTSGGNSWKGELKIWNLEHSHWQSVTSFESGKYNSILRNFIILIIDVSNVMIPNFKFSNSNHGWLQISSLITGWICWKFYDIGGPLDLSKAMCKHKLGNKKIYTEGVCFLSDILNCLFKFLLRNL